MTIRGSVAEILDKTTLVANIGAEDGVKEGMEFEIFEDGPMITDPETGEELGRPETVKTMVVADDVKEAMTLMSTLSYTTTTNNVGGLIGRLYNTPKMKQHKLDTDEAMWEDRKKVRVGDSIRQVSEVEETGSEEGGSEGDVRTD